jgi:hypothetical protein
VEAAAQHRLGNAKAVAEFVKSAAAVQHIADDKQHPAVTENIE